jgi:NAD(P)-dependent dehydrogenase (short-subunit alcohol dehydrogenase family)
MIDLEDKVIVVTGAGKGLGRAYALALGARGATVVVNNRKHTHEAMASADSVVAEIRQVGGRGQANYDSVDAPGAGERIVAETVDRFGRLDAVIANAGVSQPIAFHRETVSHVREVLGVNLFGSLDIVHSALPHLRATGSGRVLLTTSSAIFGDAGFVAYTTAKAALIGCANSLSQESGRAGVHVNAILPFATTPMTAPLMESGVFPEGAGELMQPESVAQVAVWLVSSACDRTGEIWAVGGRVVRRVAFMLNEGFVFANDFTADDVAAHAAEITDMRTVKTLPDGASMLREMIELNQKPLRPPAGA